MEKEQYWKGPYGVLVPNRINSVVAKDGYNYHSRDGGITEKFMLNAPKMNEKIYKETFCNYCEVTKNWYYKSKI